MKVITALPISKKKLIGFEPADTAAYCCSRQGVPLSDANGIGSAFQGQADK